MANDERGRGLSGPTTTSRGGDRLETGSRRVVIVDDDDISRRGFEAILEAATGIDVVLSVDHDSALDHIGEWPPVDVLLVDAADTRRQDDHFIGAELVERFRGLEHQRHAVVMVVTGHFFSDPLRRRMREARADLFLHRSEVQDEHRLVEVVRDPRRATMGVAPEQENETMFRLGVGPETRVNAAVAHHRRGSANEPDTDRSARPPVRAALRRRERFQQVARLRVVNADGRPPERRRVAPSMPQIERFIDWATRATRE